MWFGVDRVEQRRRFEAKVAEERAQALFWETNRLLQQDITAFNFLGLLIVIVPKLLSIVIKIFSKFMIYFFGKVIVKTVPIFSVDVKEIVPS